MWLFLIIGAANKDIKSKKKFWRKSWLKYFEASWCFAKFSSHHKWKKAWPVHGICEFPYELPSDLRLRILVGNYSQGSQVKSL